MVTKAYLMTPMRRARILKDEKADVAEGIKRVGGGVHIACSGCRKPIRVLSWTVSVSGTRRSRQYHYRCWKWGGVPSLDDLRGDRKNLRRRMGGAGHAG